jgi:hypothetical protein
MRTLGAAIGAIAITAAVTIPAVATTHSAPTPAARTCAAFRVWDAHRTVRNLDVTMTASESVPWTRSGASAYIADDAYGLYGDVRSGAKAHYIAQDVKYFSEDCKGK